MARGKVYEELMDQLEEVLITSDIGMETTMRIIEELRVIVKQEVLVLPENIKKHLKAIMVKVVKGEESSILPDNRPLVILMVGINGGGKTTTIGKLAYRLKSQGDQVLLVAADTFRAAAADQLEIWGNRNGINTIRHKEGADPSAVLFDGIQAAKSRNVNVLICDTAGRLQNKKNLMQELEKMSNVIKREFPEAVRETLLVLDATTGKNAVSQAREFDAVSDLSGIVLTKLDGTAKGGIVLTIVDELHIPVKFIGVGEGLEDLQPFSPEEFVGGIFDE
jgi:fused signal recognition particle receptor